MRVFAFLGLALATGCGLSLEGGLFGTPETPDAGNRDASVTPMPTMTATTAAPDATPDAEPDAGPGPIDAAPDTQPPQLSATNVKVSYAAGKDGNVYKLVGSTFTALTSDKCPAGEETAVMTDGRIFITSSDSSELHSVDPTTGKCTPIKKASANTFPFALGVAPKGTLSATSDRLIGYRGSDYVEIDDTSGVVSIVGSNALAGQVPRGDVTSINMDGYVAIRSGSGTGAMNCLNGAGDCVQKVNLTTGAPVGTPIQIPAQILGLAQDRGTLLLYRTVEVSSVDLATKTLTSVAPYPANANFTGAGAAPWQ
jgi:hypothetical protein